MKKLILIPFFLIGALLLVGCYKDDLAEFQSIKRIEVKEEIAVPVITQTLDTSFEVPIPIPTGFALADTISVELPEQNDTAEFVIDEVTFKAKTENRFNFPGVFSIIFLDSLGVKKDSLPGASEPEWVIRSAPSGSSVVDNFSINIDTARYNDLTQYSKVILQIEYDAGSSGIPAGQYDLDITYFVGVHAKGRVKIGL
jgi:hypothetical protein